MFKLLLSSAILFFIGYGIFSFLGRLINSNRNQSNNQGYNNSSQAQPQQDSKRFNKDVGEYVPYEEVKDDKK